LALETVRIYSDRSTASELEIIKGGLMPAMNCRACGTPFQGGINDHLCPPCREKEVEMFQKVRDYIREHPAAKVDEIAEGTEVDERVILRFINQGRLKTK
jgi:uncharacterized Zn finger protein (UPF0148 family)